MNFVIGIAGPARSGKDTYCELLREQLYINHVPSARYAFADPIKEAIKKAFLLNESHVNGALKETPIPALGNKSPRQMLQWFGTEYGRQMIDPDIWLNVAQRFIDKLPRSVIVIPDVRFENEADWIRERGFLLHIERADCAGVTAHVSEAGIQREEDEPVILNDGSLDDLAESAKDLVGIFIDYYRNNQEAKHG